MKWAPTIICQSRSSPGNCWHGNVDPNGLTTEPPDLQTFRCLALAYEAGRAGGTAPAVLSAANEIAVEAFLAERLPWSGIAEIVEEVLDAGTGSADEMADVLAADAVARERARASVLRRSAA